VEPSTYEKMAKAREEALAKIRALGNDLLVILYLMAVWSQWNIGKPHPSELVTSKRKRYFVRRVIGLKEAERYEEPKECDALSMILKKTEFEVRVSIDYTTRPRCRLSEFNLYRDCIAKFTCLQRLSKRPGSDGSSSRKFLEVSVKKLAVQRVV
jgi:hypothetical protein